MTWADRQSFAVRKRTAPLFRFFHPGYGACHRCGMPWSSVELHETPYKPGRGMFALCESCWRELPTTHARLPYYREVFLNWNDYEFRPESEWAGIVAAVLAGK